MTFQVHPLFSIILVIIISLCSSFNLSKKLVYSIAAKDSSAFVYPSLPFFAFLFFFFPRELSSLACFSFYFISAPQSSFLTLSLSVYLFLSIQRLKYHTAIVMYKILHGSLHLDSLTTLKNFRKLLYFFLHGFTDE